MAIYFKANEAGPKGSNPEEVSSHLWQVLHATA